MMTGIQPSPARKRPRPFARLTCLAIAMLLPACSGAPAGTGPAEPETTRESRPMAIEAAMPPDLLPVFPNGHVFSVARFVSRTLETAPDGESRRWPAMDRDITLVIRPDRTEFIDGAVCRRATLIIGGPQGEQRFLYRACRQPNGLWSP